MKKKSLFACTIILISLTDCKPPAKTDTRTTLERFQQNVIKIDESFKGRLHDCISAGFSTSPVPFEARHPEFDYLGKKVLPNMYSGFTNEDNWPILFSLLVPEKGTQPQRIFMTFRGDTLGYHKSFITRPYLEFMKNDRPDDAMLFLDEYNYVKNKTDITKDHIMTFCHHRTFWFGNCRYNYPGVENGRGWKALEKLAAPDDKLILVSYSNGTWPRMEFIARELKPGFNPDYRQVKNFAEFLDLYITSSADTYARAEQIEGFIDFEGNYINRKPLWDILAFIRTKIENNPRRFYYSVTRVDKPDAFPVQVKMIKALGLKGKEEGNGIVRYKNTAGNVIIDIITNPYRPYYYNNGADLKTDTVFEPYSGNDMKRMNLSHYNLIPIGIKRFIETGFARPLESEKR